VDVEVNTGMKPCSYKFLKQCTFWQFYASVSVGIATVLGFVIYNNSISDWTVCMKFAAGFGAFTCLCWWLWCVKKIKDIAFWWFDLHHKLEQTHILLNETKQDLKIIKQSYKQENNLFT
jgi:hypothetical protein